MTPVPKKPMNKEPGPSISEKSDPTTKSEPTQDPRVKETALPTTQDPVIKNEPVVKAEPKYPFPKRPASQAANDHDRSCNSSKKSVLRQLRHDLSERLPSHLWRTKHQRSYEHERDLSNAA